MIGVDTNVLVRFFAQDDPAQSALASTVLDARTASDPAFVSTVTLVETVWVLTRAYKTPRGEIARILETLLRAPEIVVEDAAIAYRALKQYADGGSEFADAMIVEAARRAGAVETVTFDRGAVAAGMRVLGP